MVDICTLPSRALFRLTGSDAADWLQDLITNDVECLEDEGALYAALLSPQGKILFDFLVYSAQEGMLIDCEAASLDALMKRLSMYKLRSDVTLAAEPDLGVISSCTPLDEALPFVEVAAPDPRLEKLGYRMVGNLARMQTAYEEQGHRVDGEDVYRDYLLGLGIPGGGEDFAAGKAYPLESNFEELHGVSFSKGCFIGQEVVARMKHKAVLKKRTLPFTCEANPPAAGSEIRAGPSKVGDVLASAASGGIALIRLNEWRAALAAGQTLEVDGIKLSVSVPEWLDLKEEARPLQAKGHTR